MSKRGNKRGLSQVVTTILLVLLIIAAIAGIWVAINTFILKNSQGLTLGNIGLDVQIKSALVNTTDGTATVRVERNKGVSKLNITSLKFIVEDTKNSDIFEIPVTNFEELAVRTFDLNLTKNGILDPTNIIKISVAPIYISDTTGKNETSPVTSSYDIGQRDKIIVDIKICHTNSDCGTDQWIAGSQICNADSTGVLQYKRIYECFGATNPNGGFCQQKTEALPVETCTANQTCLGGACQLPNIACTPENVTQDCGVSQYVGFPTCNPNAPPERIIQDYDLFDCVNNTCTENITSKTIQDCPSPQVCAISGGSPECFSPLQCTVNEDCPLGQVCRQGNCTQEFAALNGTVSSSWPPGLNEFFDSAQLPRNASNATINYIGYTIIFPGSLQKECLTVQDYTYPPTTDYNAYIQLSSKQTNITTGNQFQLWETKYGCVVLNNSL